MVLRRGRWGTVCARGAYPALLGGPSTSPLGGDMRHLTVFNATVLIWLALGTDAQAWLVPIWSVPQLLDEATLTVVAKPISAKVVIAKGVLPEATSGRVDDEHVYVDDVETTLQVLSVVKGDAANHIVMLHHQRSTNHRGPIMAGPGLVDFEPGSGKR